MVMAQEESLRPQATAIAQRLRSAGRRVDLVLEGKRMKWAFKQAERCNSGGCWWGGAAGREGGREGEGGADALRNGCRL